MTPAELVAAKKASEKARRVKRAGPPKAKTNRKIPWLCHIRTRRADMGLSLRDVAAGAGTTAGTLHQIERGMDPLLTTAKRLADFFGLAVEDLWTPVKKASE